MQAALLNKLDDPKLQITSVAVLARKNKDADSGAHHHFVYIGTNDGCITQYAVTATPAPNPLNPNQYGKVASTQASKRSMDMGKSPVTQMVVATNLKEPHLIALCDGKILMPNCETLNRTYIFAHKDLEGATAVCLALGTDESKLAAAVKGKIAMFQFSEGNAAPMNSGDGQKLSAPDTILQMAWTGTTIILASKKEYFVYDTRTHQLFDQVPFEKSQGPLLKQVGNTAAIALRIGLTLTLWTGKGGRSSLDTCPTLTFPEEVSGLSYVEPFYVAHTSTGKTLLRSTVDEQDLDSPAGVIQSGQPPVFRGYTSQGTLAYCCTAREIFAFHPQPFLAPVMQFIEAGQPARAVEHFKACYKGPEDQYGAQLKKVHFQCALEAFKMNNDEEAFEHFQQSACDPSDVITLFPDLQRPGHDSPNRVRAESVSSVRKARSASKAPGGAAPVGGAGTRASASPPINSSMGGVPGGQNFAATLQAMDKSDVTYKQVYDYLQSQRGCYSDQESCRAVDYALLVLMAEGKVTLGADSNMKTGGDLVELKLIARKVKKMDTFGKSDPYFILSRLLPGGRKDLLHQSEVVPCNLDPDWKPCPKFRVDQLTGENPDEATLELQLYDRDVGSSDDFIGVVHFSYNELLRTSQNRTRPLIVACGAEDCGHLFAEKFVKTKDPSRKAGPPPPGGLTDGAAKEVEELFFPSNSLDLDECELYLQSPLRPVFLASLYASKGKYTDSLELCKTHNLVAAAVAPLQLCENTKIVADHLPWMIISDASTAVRGVCHPTKSPNAPELILSLINGCSGDVTRTYLNFVIYQQKCRESTIHTSHALNLLKMIQQLQLFSIAVQPSLEVPAGMEAGPFGQRRRELLRFLAHSNYYNADVVLADLDANPHGGLWEEKAMVYSKMKDHHQVLSIFVYHLNNIAAAEDYCVKCHAAEEKAALEGRGRSESNRSENPMSPRGRIGTFLGSSNSFQGSMGGGSFEQSVGDASGNFNSTISGTGASGTGGDNANDPRFNLNELFTTLISVLMAPPAGKEPRLDEAVKLLDRQSRVINPLSVLETLPSKLAVAQIAPYLRRIFQKLGHKRQVGHVASHASKAQQCSTEIKRYELQQRQVLMDDDRGCDVCKKPLSGDVFVVFPNLKVVHFRCFKDKSLDPVRGVPFKAV